MKINRVCTAAALTFIALWALAPCVASAQSARHNALQKVLNLIPAEADAAFLAPHLKFLSDEATRLLEGMDRAQLLLGSRPIDQFKSVTGFNIGVDDAGGAAIVMLPAMPANPVQGDELAAPDIIAVIPVTDADAFLRGNFVTSQGNAHTRADGLVLFARSMTTHIALAATAAALDRYQPAKADAAETKAAAWVNTALNERGKNIITQSEAFLIARDSGVHYAFERLGSGSLLPFAPKPFPAWADQRGKWIGDVQSVLVGLDFDPLAVVMRSQTQFKPQSALWKLAAGGARGAEGEVKSGAGLTRLPNKPFYFAASIDVNGLGGAAGIGEVARMFNAPDAPQWLTQASSVQFAAYPSPAGVSGGLLNDAVLVLRTPQPASARDSFRQHLLQTNAGGAIVQGSWEENRQLKDIGSIDAYQVKLNAADLPPNLQSLFFINQILFGSAGWRGFVGQTADSLVMTFSQRPAVLQAALQAGVQPIADQDRAGLAGDGAIRMMRNWMPSGQPDIEIYISIGRLMELAQQAMKSLGGQSGGAMANAIRGWNAAAPPIGIGIEFSNHEIETATILPAAVLGAWFDQALRNVQAPAVE